MVNSSKEQEREKLGKAIMNRANDLYGNRDGCDFERYVFGSMRYRYISENITDYINSEEFEAGNTSFDYAEISNEKPNGHAKIWPKQKASLNRRGK